MAGGGEGARVEKARPGVAEWSGPCAPPRNRPLGGQMHGRELGPGRHPGRGWVRGRSHTSPARPFGPTRGGTDGRRLRATGGRAGAGRDKETLDWCVEEYPWFEDRIKCIRTLHASGPLLN